MTIGDNRYLCSNGSCSYPCPLKTSSGHCPNTVCINQNAKKGIRIKTYGEIFKEFKDKYPIPKVEDYRPFDSEFIKDKSGIVVWLKNGDMVAYFPKSNIIEE